MHMAVERDKNLRQDAGNEPFSTMTRELDGKSSKENASPRRVSDGILRVQTVVAHNAKVTLEITELGAVECGEGAAHGPHHTKAESR